MELEAQKALLVRDILTEINDKEMLKKLRKALERIMKVKAEEAVPCQYTLEEVRHRLLKTEQDALDGKGISHEEVMKEMDEDAETEKETISKEEILAGIDAGLKEVKQTMQGKLKHKTAREFIDEL